MTPRYFKVLPRCMLYISNFLLLSAGLQRPPYSAHSFPKHMLHSPTSPSPILDYDHHPCLSSEYRYHPFPSTAITCSRVPLSPVPEYRDHPFPSTAITRSRVPLSPVPRTAITPHPVLPSPLPPVLPSPLPLYTVISL